jgi:lipopolysaccharide export system permease protein
MSIINRYIVSTYLRLIGLCAGSFVAIYLVIDFLEKVGRFTRAQGSAYNILLFFIYKIPEIANQITPLAVLMATLLTLGMLSRQSEIIAMRSCGISMTRITAPLLITAFIISIGTFIIAEFVMPVSFSRMQYIQNVLIEKKSPNAFFKQQNIWYKEENTLLQARIFDPSALALKGVTIWHMEAGMRPIERIEADTAVFSDSGWHLKNVVIRGMSGGDLKATTKIMELPVPLKLKVADLKVLEKEAGSMGLFALGRYCNKLRKGGYDDTRYRAQLHSRVSLPFATLVMAFLGIPFALRSGRTSGIAVGIGISLGIGFCYFAINAVLLSLGQAGILPPFISAWAANFIFAGIGVWLAMTVNR